MVLVPTRILNVVPGSGLMRCAEKISQTVCHVHATYADVFHAIAAKTKARGIQRILTKNDSVA